MIRREQAEQLLQTAIGSAEITFRPGQWEAIDRLVNRRGRALVVQRTGWGKSMVYFIAAKLLRDEGTGPVVIVSPLLALMRNQIEAAGRLGLEPATINSSNTAEWPAIRRRLEADEVDILLVSPERLANDEFVREDLQPIAGRIPLLVVDEAHCISDWGHDFRPDYRRIVGVLRQLPRNVAVLATTATANARVVADVEAQLGEDLAVIRGPLIRDSLRLQVLRLPDAAARLAWLAERIPSLPGTGIVYALTARDAVRVARWLGNQGVQSAAYYGDAESDEREQLEQQLLGNELKCLVATTALGMGFDKPDLGFVIHYQAPGSVVFYYQQVGRAGRAIPEAFGVLMSGSEDDDINAFFRNRAFPPEPFVDAVLRALGEAEGGLSIPQIEASVNLRRSQIEQVLKLLAVETPSPVQRDGSRWFRTAARYRMDHARIERLTHRREEEWEQMRQYMAGRTCLMQFLADALDDPDAAPCGRCAVCVGAPILPESVSRAKLAEAQRFLRRSEIPLKPKELLPASGFPQYGWRGGRMPDNLRSDWGRILARWGETGSGELVKNGKAAGRFPEELVEAAVELVRARWPDARDASWVTCVPSLRHPRLVPDFATRLARALRLPFHDVVTKNRETRPQKEMENTAHRCRNLDGVFSVEGDVPHGTVLLVDDVTDSGWTLAVIAGLLREAGSGRVLPLALASSANE